MRAKLASRSWALLVLLGGCGLPRGVVEWRIDKTTDSFIEEVKAPAATRAAYQELIREVKTTTLDAFVWAGRMADQAELELAGEQPDVKRVVQIVERVLARLDGLPVPAWIERAEATYKTLDSHGRWRFWTALRKRRDDETPEERAKRKAKALKKQRERWRDALERLALDKQQSARLATLRERIRAQRKRNRRAWKTEREAAEAQMKLPLPKLAILRRGALAGWSHRNTDAIRAELPQWLRFYRSLRPEQRGVFHELLTEMLDDLPRLR